jgi:hypothetical protein
VGTRPTSVTRVSAPFFWLDYRFNEDDVDTSQQSKEHSKQVLKELGGEKAFYGKQGQGE